jgi:hypothetical protein
MDQSAKPVAAVNRGPMSGAARNHLRRGIGRSQLEHADFLMRQLDSVAQRKGTTCSRRHIPRATSVCHQGEVQVTSVRRA